MELRPIHSRFFQQKSYIENLFLNIIGNHSSTRNTKTCFGHLGVKTTGIRPIATTVFAMLCRQRLKAKNMIDTIYVLLIRHMVENGASITERERER